MTAFVFLHGFAQTPASWDAVVQRLQAAGHRTYVLDLYESKGDLKLLGTEGALEDAEQGKGVEGDWFDEYHVDNDALYQNVLETFYKKAE